MWALDQQVGLEITRHTLSVTPIAHTALSLSLSRALSLCISLALSLCLCLSLSLSVSKMLAAGDERIKTVAVEGFINIAKVFTREGALEDNAQLSTKVKETTLIDSLNAIISDGQDYSELVEKAKKLLEMINGVDADI